MDERLISPEEINNEDELDYTLRPKTLDEYVGQEQIKSNLKIYIQASKMRKEPLDHVLLYGPPGLGKTTLSHIIANELGVEMHLTSGPTIERAGDLAAILTNLGENDVLFIDEIHRLNRAVEEVLYPAMEDYVLDIMLGKGPSARSMRINLPKFTLIGATTRAGMLTGPLRDRFGIIGRLEIYTPNQLAKILRRSAGILGIQLSEDACTEISRRSRGTPRIANRLLKRIRDFADVEGSSVITGKIAEYALKCMEIDELGLDYSDKKVILTMLEKFAGKPVGLDTLAAATGEEAVTIEEAIEPYLIQIGFISRTGKGRICLPAAYKHFGFDLSEDERRQLSIFEVQKSDENA